MAAAEREADQVRAYCVVFGEAYRRLYGMRDAAQVIENPQDRESVLAALHPLLKAMDATFNKLSAIDRVKVEGKLRANGLPVKRNQDKAGHA